MHHYVVTVEEPHPTNGLTFQWDVNVVTVEEDRAEAFRKARQKLRNMAPKARPIIATYVRPTGVLV